MDLPVFDEDGTYAVLAEGELAETHNKNIGRF
jgi:hypothetical protein